MVNGDDDPARASSEQAIVHFQRRSRTGADINLPTTPTETVENEPLLYLEAGSFQPITRAQFIAISFAASIALLSCRFSGSRH
jgi:hypothetical protein